ncbi:hypothetical protein [Tahibacter harae]|uniref:Parallel beta helix pectate lyase-like protein n=1 Tax=Tahibacter harae TaxID=2963937 RepID=A0ABT1QT91_9GAMM|nr:hypothetical protein [Tahibacter harae]MCQ4165517.1 hypothetical protein [Tahibacter harae]
MPACRLHPIMAVLLLTTVPAQAVVVDSGPVAIPVTADANGIHLNLVDGSTLPAGSDLHIVADAGGRLSFAAGAAAAVLVRDGAVASLDESLAVAPAASYASSGILAPGRLLAGGVHHIGLRFVDEAGGATRYGYVQLRTTAPLGYPATLLRYAYETAGAAITVPGESRLFSDTFQTFTADSCEPAAVAEQAGKAVNPGSTVLIPAGDCEWQDEQVTFAPGVSVRGAGRGRTILRRKLAMPDWTNALLHLRCDGGRAGGVADLTLIGNAIEADLDNGIWLDGRCLDFTVRDVRASGFSNAGIQVRGHDPRGVIYRSELLSNFRCAGGCYGYGVVVYSDADPEGPPMPPLALGSADAVFIEDSYFADNRHAVASNHGSRYVFRHNTVLTTARTRGTGMIDAHGAGNTGEHGSRSYEIYANYLGVDTRVMQTADGIVIRGGDGVVFDNVMPWMPYELRLRNEVCSGTYPLHDQPREVHLWNNRFTPRPDIYGPTGAVWVDAACVPYIVENRDYYRFPRPGYLPYAYPHPLR